MQIIYFSNNPMFDEDFYNIIKPYLEEREYSIVTDRAKKITYAELGIKYNVTRERIRQIHMKALRKMRHPKISGRLKEYLLDNSQTLLNNVFGLEEI